MPDSPRRCANELAHLGEAVGCAAHAEDEVGPIERADEELRIDEPQLLGDVALHALGGGGRVGMDADAGKCLLESPQAAVLGAEVVTPRR